MVEVVEVVEVLVVVVVRVNEVVPLIAPEMVYKLMSPLSPVSRRKHDNRSHTAGPKHALLDATMTRHDSVVYPIHHISLS